MDATDACINSTMIMTNAVSEHRLRLLSASRARNIELSVKSVSKALARSDNGKATSKKMHLVFKQKKPYLQAYNAWIRFFIS